MQPWHMIMSIERDEWTRRLIETPKVIPRVFEELLAWSRFAADVSV